MTSEELYTLACNRVLQDQRSFQADNSLAIKLHIRELLEHLESEIREPMNPALARDCAWQIAMQCQRLIDLEKARIQTAIEETNP